jgi:flagellin-like hook-associated protein FlgL
MVNTGKVHLTAAKNTNLHALKGHGKLMDRTQHRLSTGLKVNSAMDSPTAYFTATGLHNRSGELDTLLDSMGQAIQKLKLAEEGIRAITKLAEQARALASQASELSENPTNAIDQAKRASLASQYDLLRTQISELANDTSYKGINLINDTMGLTSFTIYFNEQLRASPDVTRLVINAVDATADGLGMTLAQNDWSTNADVDTDMDLTLTAIEMLRTFAHEFSIKYSVVQNRENFTESLINVLTEGANKLTLADMNEETANMLALQTRHQLGINSLSLASQAYSAVLSLF